MKKKRAGKKNAKNKDNKRGSQEIDDINKEIQNQSIDELEESLYSKTMNTHKSKKSIETNKSKSKRSAHQDDKKALPEKQPNIETLGQSIEDRVLIVNKSQKSRKDSLNSVNYDQEL